MKKTVIIALFLLIATISFGQDTVSKAIKKLKKEKGIEQIEISGFFAQLAGMTPFTGLSSEEKSFLKKTDRLLILTSNGEKKVNFYEDLKNKIKVDKYEQLVSIKGEDERVLIMARPTDDGLSDLLVITMGDDQTLIHLKGDFDAAFIKKLLNN